MPQTTTTTQQPRAKPGLKGAKPRSRSSRKPVALDVVAKAIQARTDADALQAATDARRLLAIFAGKDKIEDEPLDKETRAFLYNLHSRGVIRNHIVEHKNEQGRDWLYFFWLLEWPHLERLAAPPEAKGPAAHRDAHHPAAPPRAVA